MDRAWPPRRSRSARAPTPRGYETLRASSRLRARVLELVVFVLLEAADATLEPDVLEAGDEEPHDQGPESQHLHDLRERRFHGGLARLDAGVGERGRGRPADRIAVLGGNTGGSTDLLDRRLEERGPGR